MINFLSRNLYVIGAIILAFILILLLWKVPQWQSNAYRGNFTDEEIQKLSPQEKIQLERNAADIENATRLTLAQIIGGLVLLVGLYFTYQNVKAAQDNAKTAQENIKLTQENLRITEEGKLTERFSKAVELFGSEKIDIRLGGIYALERIARDSQKDHWTVMEILTAFVRENSHKKEEDISPREDIQAIMTVIGRRKWSETETQRLNLEEVNLTKYALTEANLRRTNLFSANLIRADLTRADLIEVNLRGADLHDAFLNGADLSKADLSNANLSNAYLIEVNLSGAFLIGANLSGANLSGANLSGANLSGAEFITSEQILSANNAKKAILPTKLEK